MSAITPQTLVSPFASTSGSAGYHAVTFAATSGSPGDYWTTNGKDVLFAYNSSGSAGTITITSANDEKNRTEDITTYSIPALSYAAFCPGLTNSKGWMDSSKRINFATSATTINVAVVRLPDGYPS